MAGLSAAALISASHLDNRKSKYSTTREVAHPIPQLPPHHHPAAGPQRSLTSSASHSPRGITLRGSRLRPHIHAWPPKRASIPIACLARALPLARPEPRGVGFSVCCNIARGRKQGRMAAWQARCVSFLFGCACGQSVRCHATMAIALLQILSRRPYPSRGPAGPSMALASA